MKREEQIRLARQLLESGVLSEESANAIKADFPELDESEDEKYYKMLHDCLSSFVKGKHAFVLTDAKGCLAWLEKQKEQKPAEWSEEKEKALDNYVDEIIKWENAHKDWNREVIRATAFHFFNLQPKQEWSEEDEKMLNTITGILDGGIIGLLNKDIEKLHRWLKSLRPQPHWKPSEEQMQALKHAYSIMNGQAGTDLANLYYELKKLH